MNSCKHYILNGWPSRVSKVPENVKSFWNVRHELSEMNGVILKSEHVLPCSLRDRIITFAHEGRMGITKCKSRIREFYWWPGVNANVESVLRSCKCCHELPRDSPVQVSNFVH